MSLYAYEIFDAVVKEKSFLKASERLHLSPSAISHSVARLEERFQAKLFNRNRSQIELTAAGERLLPYIRTILRDESLLNQEADYLHGEVLGTVRLGTLGSICRAWLPDMINRFNADYPGIKLVISQGSMDLVLNWVRLKSVDLAFIPEEFAKDQVRTKLHKDRLICIAPADFVPINGKSVTTADLEANNLINYYGRNNTDAELFLEKNGVTFNSSFHVDDVFTLVSMVECGFGIGITTELSTKGTRRKVKKYPLEPDYYRTISLVETDPDFQTRAVYTLRDFIISFLEAENEDKNSKKKL